MNNLKFSSEIIFNAGCVTSSAFSGNSTPNIIEWSLRVLPVYELYNYKLGQKTIYMKN